MVFMVITRNRKFDLTMLTFIMAVLESKELQDILVDYMMLMILHYTLMKIHEYSWTLMTNFIRLQFEEHY